MIRLFYNYYEDKHSERKKEIDFCLQQNLANKFVNTIIIESQNRMTYADFFGKINHLTNDYDISIICNSDIFLDDTIELVNSIKDNEMYALSRWDWQPDGNSIFCNRRDSQDVWIVRGKVKDVFGNFHLGKGGCDNRIAYEFKKSGYLVYNPSLSIRTHHVHNTNIRTYTPADTIPGPYLTLEPEKIRA